MGKHSTKLPFNMLSDTDCVVPGCNRKIKQRHIENRPGGTPHKCFPHHVNFEAGRGHFLKGADSHTYTGGH